MPRFIMAAEFGGILFLCVDLKKENINEVILTLFGSILILKCNRNPIKINFWDYLLSH